MYTGLRASVVVKHEWIDAIRLLHETDWKTGRWETVFATFPYMPGLADWVKVGRRNFIPFGGLAYMPDDFSDTEDGRSYSSFDPKTGRWRFCCSLKNYEGEIGQFAENVLRHIVSSVEYCESLYEEHQYDYDQGWADEPTHWSKWTTKWLEDLKPDR